MTDSTLASTIDNHVGDLETAITDILGIPIDTNISAALFDVTSSGLTRINFISVADGTPNSGELWLSSTTADTLKYNHSGTTRSVVDLSLTQTLTNKTLTAPVLSGTATGTYTLGGTPTIGASMTWSAAQNLNSQAFTNVNIDSGTIDGVTITAPTLSGTLAGTYTLGGTPTVGVSMTWSAAQNLNSQALTNVNIDSGTVDGVTITSPTLAGTAIGTYTLGGTPTLSSNLAMSSAPNLGATGATNRAGSLYGAGFDLSTGTYLLSRYSADTTGSVLSFRKARGTEAAPGVAISAGDVMGELAFWGWDEAKFVKAGSIVFDARSGPAVDHMPSGIRIWSGFNGNDALHLHMSADLAYSNTAAGTSYPSTHSPYPFVFLNGRSGSSEFVIGNRNAPVGEPAWNTFDGPANGILGGSNTTLFYVNSAIQLAIMSTGVLKVGGSTATRATTEGTDHLDIFDGTAPVGTLANGISLYSTAGELNVMDAGGTATPLSPHRASILNQYQDPSDPFPWVYAHRNPYLGIEQEVVMSAVIREVERLSGKTFIKTRSLPQREVLDWDTDQEKLRLQGEKEIAEAKQAKTKAPPPHQKVAPPKWMRDRGVRSAIP